VILRYRRPFLFTPHLLQRAQVVEVNSSKSSSSCTIAIPINWLAIPEGVIAERNKVDFTKAFHEIRTLARQEQRPVRAVAAEIVANHHCLFANGSSVQK
jgi:hypothetical protein